jgi:hypothetical protein
VVIETAVGFTCVFRVESIAATRAPIAIIGCNGLFGGEFRIGKC